MNTHDFGYAELIRMVLEQGERRSDRTGTGTTSLFGWNVEFDISTSFPLITTKKVHWKSVVHELLWFLRGDTNVAYLRKNKVTIWDEWAKEDGELGPIYGKQWRRWETVEERPLSWQEELLKDSPSVTNPDAYGTRRRIWYGSIDQITNLINGLRNDPYSRRHVVSAWNVGELGQMALPPCHAFWQVYVSQATNQLSLHLYQRSCDLGLGAPFNLASYSLLLCILADTLGFERGKFHWSFGDLHVYDNHKALLEEQIQRTSFAAPTLAKIVAPDPLSVTFEQIQLLDYVSHPALKLDVAV